ncbi:nitroreductase family protein [bacterium]|nr:nitroreductase family protein [bacterium]
MNENLIIDKEKCVNCAQCVNDCITHCIKMSKEENIPVFRKGGEERCIKCQHCMTICPTGALTLWGKNPENSDAVNPEYNSEELLRLIKSRRSYRKYRQENLDEERMNKLKDMINWAPTGVNNHRLYFSFIDDMEVMDDFRNKVNTKLVNLLNKTPFKGIKQKFSRYIKAILAGEDVIFRNAPHMVVVSTPLDAPCKDIDPVIALSYFELYAQSMGVATLWCGLAEACLKLFPEFSEYLEIPDNYKASYVMLFGLTDKKYHRTTQPDKYNIISVKKKDNNTKVSLFRKIQRFIWNF